MQVDDIGECPSSIVGCHLLLNASGRGKERVSLSKQMIDVSIGVDTLALFLQPDQSWVHVEQFFVLLDVDKSDEFTALHLELMIVSLHPSHICFRQCPYVVCCDCPEKIGIRCIVRYLVENCTGVDAVLDVRYVEVADDYAASQVVSCGKHATAMDRRRSDFSHVLFVVKGSHMVINDCFSFFE